MNDAHVSGSLWRCAPTLLLGLVLAAGPAPGTLAAQEPPATLTLEEAIRIARQNNPDYRSRHNDIAAADWSVREAWGSLLPGASVSGGMQYQRAGQARFGVFTTEDLGVGSTPPYYISDYSVGVSYRFDAGTLPRLSEAKASRRATAANVDAAEHDLAQAVTQQYLSVLRAAEAVRINRSELDRADENLALARARVEVGSAIEMEAKQAQVERGRAEVALIRAENQRESEMLLLIEQLGIEMDRSLDLTTRFDVFRPDWTEAELLSRATASHPRLHALEAQLNAGEAATRAARGTYLPSLELSAGWSGFTRQVGDRDYVIGQAEQRLESQWENCVFLNQLSDRLTSPLPGTPADCSSYESLSPEERDQILDRNDVFPFGFTRQPFSVRLGVSIPIFQGFTRQRQVAAARARTDDARHALRAERLRLRTQIVSLYRSLDASYRTVQIERENRELADDQLRLAQERYRVGSANFLELTEAETIKARADRAYLDAVYEFHDTLAALEAAVGATLRPDAVREESNR